MFSLGVPGGQGGEAYGGVCGGGGGGSGCGGGGSGGVAFGRLVGHGSGGAILARERCLGADVGEVSMGGGDREWSELRDICCNPAAIPLIALQYIQLDHPATYHDRGIKYGTVELPRDSQQLTVLP